MVTWYIVSADRIRTVEITKYTESSVWIGDRRQARLSSYENFFPDWQQARDFLMEKWQRRIENSEKTLEAQKRLLASIEAMTPPIEARISTLEKEAQEGKG